MHSKQPDAVHNAHTSAERLALCYQHCVQQSEALLLLLLLLSCAGLLCSI
jgi:hypothetical protein